MTPPCLSRGFSLGTGKGLNGYYVQFPLTTGARPLVVTSSTTGIFLTEGEEAGAYRRVGERRRGSVCCFGLAPLGQDYAAGKAGNSRQAVLLLQAPEVVINHRCAADVTASGDLPNGWRVRIAGGEVPDERQHPRLPLSKRPRVPAGCSGGLGFGQPVRCGAPFYPAARDAQASSDSSVGPVSLGQVDANLHPITVVQLAFRHLSPVATSIQSALAPSRNGTSIGPIERTIQNISAPVNFSMRVCKSQPTDHNPGHWRAGGRRFGNAQFALLTYRGRWNRAPVRRKRKEGAHMGG